MNGPGEGLRKEMDTLMKKNKRTRKEVRGMNGQLRGKGGQNPGGLGNFGTSFAKDRKQY